jgi:hypothetical protein
MPKRSLKWQLNLWIGKEHLSYAKSRPRTVDLFVCFTPRNEPELIVFAISFLRSLSLCFASVALTPTPIQKVILPSHEFVCFWTWISVHRWSKLDYFNNHAKVISCKVSPRPFLSWWNKRRQESLVAEILGPGVGFSCLLALQFTLNVAFPESAFDCHFSFHLNG